MLLYSLTDLWFFMLKIPVVYKKDGAKRHHNFRHFRHFSSFRLALIITNKKTLQAEKCLKGCTQFS